MKSNQLLYPDGNGECSPGDQGKANDAKEEESISIFELPNLQITHKGTKTVFLFLFIFNVGANFDHGAVPAASNVLQKDL